MDVKQGWLLSQPILYFNYKNSMKNCITTEEGAEIIKGGGLVAFPTETVYGLGADAFNPEAITNVFKAKERPLFDPLIVHISELSDLVGLQKEVDENVFKLAEKFWPGPLTIVLPKSEKVPDIVTSGLPTVAVRMPAHPVALELIRKSGTVIAAPSANKFGRLSPTTAEHVKKQLPEIEHVIDGGNTTIGLESTVISLNKDGFELLRPGAISIEDLEAVIPKSKSSGEAKQLKSPGLLKSHYSPRKPLYIIGESEIGSGTSSAGLISFGISKNKDQYKYQEVLSENQDLNEAAINLFSAIHKLEDSDAEFIVAEPVPETGIGIAIMDRLRKAAYQYKM